MTIFSKKLIRDLLEIADNTALSKYAQVADLSSMLQDKLSDFLNVVKPKKITTKDNKPLNIIPKNIENINNFLEFIRENGLKINGEPIVVRVTEADKIPDQNDRLLFSSRSPNFIKWNWSEAGPGTDYNVVSKSRLEKLIKELQDTQGNPLFNVYLNSYVDKLNAASGQQLGKPFTANDSGLMDGFDTNDFNSAIIVANAQDDDFDPSSSRIKIKDVDLSSKQSFENWIKANDIKILSNKNTFIPASNDLEGMLYLLSKRASNLLSKNPNSDRFKRYKDAVQKLANSLQANLNSWIKKDEPSPGTQGKPSGSAPGTQQPTGKPGEEPSGQQGVGDQDSKTRGGRRAGELINNLFTRAPLQLNLISYPRIIDFCEQAKKMFADEGIDKNRTYGYIRNEAENIITRAFSQKETYFSAPNPTINLTGFITDDLYRKMSSPATGGTQEIIQRINEIINLLTDVYTLLQSIYNIYKDQLGSSDTISTIYNTQRTYLSSNVDALNRVKRDLIARKV